MLAELRKIIPPKDVSLPQEDGRLVSIPSRVSQSKAPSDTCTMSIQHPSQSQQVPIPGLTMVSMEDFDREMAERAAAAAAVKVEEEERQRRSFTPQSHKSKKLKTSSPSSLSSPGEPEPIALPDKKGTEWMPLLNHLAQVHGLRSEFSYAEVVQQGFRAKLRCVEPADQGGQGKEAMAFETDREVLFRSKKEAKEAVAEKGVKWLETREKRDRKSNIGPVRQDTAVDKSENWVGLLNDFCQVKGSLSSLSFKDFVHPTVSQQFSTTCTLTVGQDDATKAHTFGDPKTFFGSKKAAKASAAKDAVMYLRATGSLSVISPDGFPVAATAPTSSPLSLSAPSDCADQNNPAASNESLSPSPSPSPSLPTTDSIHAQITVLCTLLALPQPQIRCSPSDQSTPASGFVDATATFPGTIEASLRQGCRVDNVWGRKKAKEECGKMVLGLLKEIEMKRRTVPV